MVGVQLLKDHPRKIASSFHLDVLTVRLKFGLEKEKSLGARLNREESQRVDSGPITPYENSR